MTGMLRSISTTPDEFAILLERFLAVPGLCHHFKAGFGPDERNETCPDERVVVRHQDLIDD